MYHQIIIKDASVHHLYICPIDNNFLIKFVKSSLGPNGYLGLNRHIRFTNFSGKTNSWAQSFFEIDVGGIPLLEC